jgi:hypothetical protein
MNGGLDSLFRLQDDVAADADVAGDGQKRRCWPRWSGA